MQEIDRNGLHIQRLQFEDGIDQIFVSLPHASNESAAQFHASFLRDFECVESILIGMRGANLFVIPARGIQIVIDAVNTGIRQTLRLVWFEQTQTSTNM